MERLIAYRMSRDEATELLQNVLDNATLRLKRNRVYDFYEAVSEDQFLDGGQVDERLAQALGLKSCEHFAISYEGDWVLVLSREIV